MHTDSRQEYNSPTYIIEDLQQIRIVTLPRQMFTLCVHILDHVLSVLAHMEKRDHI